MKEKYLKFCDFIAKAVFERYFFQRAITWQTELVTMLLVASTFIGSVYVLSEKAHVSMEWIYDFFYFIIKFIIFSNFILFWIFNG